jgi:hypothetical protein
VRTSQTDVRKRALAAYEELAFAGWNDNFVCLALVGDLSPQKCQPVSNIGLSAGLVQLKLNR